MTGRGSARAAVFGVAVVWRPRVGCERDVEILLRAMQELTLAEPGCLSYEVHRSEEGHVFFLYEQYVDRSAYDRHHETDHYRRLVGEEAPRLIEGRDIVRGYTLGG